MTEITDLSPTDAANTSISTESLEGNVANMGRMEETLQAVMGLLARSIRTNVLRFLDHTDDTKKLALDLSGLTTATTRTVTVPDYDGTLASQALGSAIASAATTDLSAASGSTVHITGTTTITALGTADAGIEKTVVFDDILTLTHNATSLILPGAANITTAAGDTAVFVSEGSGNWRCLAYQRATGSLLPAIGTAGQSLRVNSGATGLEYQTGWETLAKGDLVAASELSLLNAGAYTRIKVSAFLTVSTDGTTIRFYTRTGGSVDTVTGGYDFVRVYSEAGAVGTNSNAAADFAPLTLSNVGNAAQEGIHFSFEIENFNKAEYAWATCRASETTSAGGRSITSGEFRRLSTTGRDGFLIRTAAGTMSGSYVIEGMRG